MQNFTHPDEIARFKGISGNVFIKYILPKINFFNESVTSMAKIPDRSFAVTKKTCPRLYDAFETAWQKLEMDNRKKCTLFCSMDYNRNITTSGTDDDALMVISSTCLEDFSDEQLLALLGREIGHLKLDHLRYLTAFNTIDSIAGLLPGIVNTLLGVRNAASTIKGWLVEMLLVTQYSADRAGAIVAGDILPVIQNNLMIAGIERAEDCVNFEGYITEKLTQDFNNLDRVTKVLMINALRELPMPFAIPRIKELLSWSSSEDCQVNFPQLYRPNQSVTPKSKNSMKDCSKIIVKGERISLLEQSKKLTFAVEYDSVAPEIEIDTFVFLTGSEGKILDVKDLVFANNAGHPSGAIVLNGEKNILINLARVPEHISKIALCISIYKAEVLRKNFGMVRGLKLKFSDDGGTLQEFSPYDLTNETSLILGEVYRYKNWWKFKAVGEGFSGGLKILGQNFGIKNLVEK